MSLMNKYEGRIKRIRKQCSHDIERIKRRTIYLDESTIEYECSDCGFYECWQVNNYGKKVKLYEGYRY